MNWALLIHIRNAYVRTGHPDALPEIDWLTFALGEWADEESNILYKW